MPIRPEWDELWDGKEALIEFFNELAKLRSFDAVRRGATPSKYRKPSDNDGAAHLLFRPMAQIALASALGHLLGAGALNTAVYWAKIRAADEDGRFRIDDPCLPWYGTAWDHITRKMRRRATDQKLVKRLLLYLLDEGTDDEEVRERLRTDFAFARQSERALARTTDAFLDEAIDLSGDVVAIGQVKLPHPW